MVTVKELLEIIDQKDNEIKELKDISKTFFEEYSNFKIEIATLLVQEIVKTHHLSVDDLVVEVQPDKVILTHLKNELFRLEFQDFKDIITYLVAMLKLDRNHRKINLVSVDEKGITVQKTDILDVHNHLREVLGEK